MGEVFSVGSILARIRYETTNFARVLSRPWRQWTIDPSEATTIFGCSFGAKGWHHILLTLDEVERNPEIRVEDTTLARYLTEFRPRSISTLAGVNDEEPLPLFVYPWGTFGNGSTNTSKTAVDSRFCGPSTLEFVEQEFERIVSLGVEMRVRGYRPQKYPYSYITGTWLEAVDGDRRFVVMQGNHRMAVMAHLGYYDVAVRTSRLALSHVKEKDIENWPLVAARRCSLDHARKVFRFFFEQSGWHIKERLAM